MMTLMVMMKVIVMVMKVIRDYDDSSFRIAIIEMTVTDRDHLETSPQLRFFHPCHPILR